MSERDIIWLVLLGPALLLHLCYWTWLVGYWTWLAYVRVRGRRSPAQPPTPPPTRTRRTPRPEPGPAPLNFEQMLSDARRGD